MLFQVPKYELRNGELGVFVPHCCDGKVYVGSADQNVYCLDASTGSKIWNYRTGKMVHSSPAVADGIVYVSSDDSKVYAFGQAAAIPEFPNMIASTLLVTLMIPLIYLKEIALVNFSHSHKHLN